MQYEYVFAIPRKMVSACELVDELVHDQQQSENEENQKILYNKMSNENNLRKLVQILLEFLRTTLPTVEEWKIANLS
jgi:hypothetical protein